MTVGDEKDEVRGSQEQVTALVLYGSRAVDVRALGRRVVDSSPAVLVSLSRGGEGSGVAPPGADVRPVRLEGSPVGHLAVVEAGGTGWDWATVPVDLSGDPPDEEPWRMHFLARGVEVPDEFTMIRAPLPPYLAGRNEVLAAW